jgi:hypothetical protein
MKKWRIRLWIPFKGVVEETHNGNTLELATGFMRAKYAFSGVLLSAEILFEVEELAKLEQSLVKTNEVKD